MYPFKGYQENKVLQILLLALLVVDEMSCNSHESKKKKDCQFYFLFFTLIAFYNRK
jgi:hypothetical protein